MCYKLIFFFFFITFSKSFFSLENNHINQLSPLNKIFTLSNYSKEERVNNFSFCEQVNELLKFLSKERDLSPYQLCEYLHLSYKLANFFQQNDRSSDAEIILEIAFIVLEKQLPSLHSDFALKAYKELKLLHPQLPAIYAALCHYKGKSYLKKPSLLLKEKDLDALEKAEILLKRALALREIIDQKNSFYEETSDSGKGHYSLHTLLFERTLGYFYFKKRGFYCC